MFEFKVRPTDITYSDYLYGRGHPQGPLVGQLFSEVDLWFDRVRTWVEAMADQDADITSPLAYLATPGGGLTIITSESETISLPATANLITVTLPDDEAITLPKFRKAVGQANAGRVPSDAHVLLRDGRAALRRGQFRRAVIDAGSATEVTLADFNRRATRVNTGSRPPTLGWYVRQPAIASGASLPANTKLDLVDIRNKAIHENRMPTRAETATAISIAAQVVNRLDPLPI